MNATAALRAYQDVGIETSVMAADPHRLVSMLFEGALVAIARGRHAMLGRQIEEKGQMLSKAIAIIGEGLHASVDRSVGGELAQNLCALYDYMVSRLVAANLNNDAAALDEVARLLTELKDAWESIRPQVVRLAARPEPTSAAPRGYGRA